MKLMTLNRIFPAEKYKKYLEFFGVIEEQGLDEKSIEQMFLIIRSDFVKGTLDLDEFALICNSLFVVMSKKHFDDDNIDLANVLDGANELSFDIRTNKKNILKFLPERVRLIFEYNLTLNHLLLARQPHRKIFTIKNKTGIEFCSAELAAGSVDTKCIQPFSLLYADRI